MSHKMLMICPAIAFALSAAAASLTMAQPLTAAPEAAEFGPGQVPWQPVGPGKLPGGLDPDIDFNPDLIVCAQTIIEVGTSRAHECVGLTGPRCVATCEIDDVACRSACEGEGAVFCAPAKLEARNLLDDDDDDDHDLVDLLDDDDDDHGLSNLLDDDDDYGDIDEVVYVNTSFCLEQEF